MQVSSNTKTSSDKYNSVEGASSHYRVMPARGSLQNGHDHPTLGKQTASTGSPLNKRSDFREKNKELRTQKSNVNQTSEDFSNSYANKVRHEMESTNLALIMSYFMADTVF